MKKVRSWRTPAKWSFFKFDDRLLLILIGAIVGISSGLAAIALNRSLISMLDMLHHYRHLWWAFILPGIGAALSSVFLEKIVKEGAGHGVPEVIYSVSRRGGLIRFRSSFSRLVSSCLTIGSGGSAGPEAPVVMSGAAIGSNIANFFSLNDRQRITLVGCGAAGAISSIFNAPIAGMVFTMEVILGEWSAVNIIPIAIASVAGTEISRILNGNQIAFQHDHFNVSLHDTLICIALAIVAALVSIILTRLLRQMHKVSKKVKTPLWIKAGIGGCVVGIMGFFMPVVLGEGYHFIHDMINGTFSTGILIAFIAVFAKIIATSFTLGWGGSGGIFAPGLVIGSLVGISFYRIIYMLWPQVSWMSEGCFALLGMAGVISGMLQAPLTGIFLIVEITGGYEVILPLILVSAISSSLCCFFEPASFYLKDLIEKGQLLRPRTDARVLADLSILELIETDCLSVKNNMLLRDFIKIFQNSKRNYFPVKDHKTGIFLGIINLDNVKPYLFDNIIYDVILVEQIMDKNTDIDTISLEDDLSGVLKLMDSKNLFSLPVVSNKKFMGMVSKATILNKYRTELMIQSTK